MVLEQIVSSVTDFMGSDKFAPAAIAVGGTSFLVGGFYVALSTDRWIKKNSFKRLYDVLETYVRQSGVVPEEQQLAALQKLADARKNKGLYRTSEFEFSDEGRLHIIPKDNKYNPVQEQLAVAFEKKRLFGEYKAYVHRGEDGLNLDSVVKRNGFTGGMSLYPPSENDLARYASLLGSFSSGQRFMPKE